MVISFRLIYHTSTLGEICNFRLLARIPKMRVFGPYHKNGPTDFSENYTPDRTRVGLSGTSHQISDPTYPKKVIFEKPTFQKIANLKKHQVFRTFRAPGPERPVGQRWPLLKGTREDHKGAIKKKFVQIWPFCRELCFPHTD